jgi:hypothetical protein
MERGWLVEKWKLPEFQSGRRLVTTHFTTLRRGLCYRTTIKPWVAPRRRGKPVYLPPPRINGPCKLYLNRLPGVPSINRIISKSLERLSPSRLHLNPIITLRTSNESPYQRRRVRWSITPCSRAHVRRGSRLRRMLVHSKPN